MAKDQRGLISNGQGNVDLYLPNSEMPKDLTAHLFQAIKDRSRCFTLGHFSSSPSVNANYVVDGTQYEFADFGREKADQSIKYLDKLLKKAPFDERINEKILLIPFKDRIECKVGALKVYEHNSLSVRESSLPDKRLFVFEIYYPEEQSILENARYLVSLLNGQNEPKKGSKYSARDKKRIEKSLKYLSQGKDSRGRKIKPLDRNAVARDMFEMHRRNQRATNKADTHPIRAG